MARTPGTAVAKAKSNLPVNISAEMAAEVDALRDRLTAPSGDKVSLKGKQFKLPNGDTSDLLSGIIVDFVYFNAYYEGAYDENNIVPPDCFSLCPDPTGAVPSDNSPSKQHDNCGACWANQFKSFGKGKACRNSVRMIVLPPDATEDTPLMVVDVSPTALKSFSAYVSSVARAFQRPPYGVITDLTFEESLAFPSLRFGNPQAIHGDLLAIVRARREEARARLLVEPDVTAAAAAPAPTPPKGRLQPPKRPAAKT